MTADHRSAPRKPRRGACRHGDPDGCSARRGVRGVDLTDLDDTAFGRLMKAWHQHSVVWFRGQPLSDQDLIAFSRRLRRSRLGPDPGERPPLRRGACRRSTSSPTSR